MTDRIEEPWGERTPFGRGEEWAERVDLQLADGLTEEDVDSWVQSAAVLHSNGDGLDIAVKDGRIVDASAERNEDFLIKTLDTDEGARRLGELGIGTNSGIDRFTKEILLDEKIGGTVHMAIGAAYPESGGTNDSAVHWDMVCDLRRGGSITVDGEVLQRDGTFVV